jgi:hypothetical protein
MSKLISRIHFGQIIKAPKEVLYDGEEGPLRTRQDLITAITHEEQYAKHMRHENDRSQMELEKLKAQYDRLSYQFDEYVRTHP